MILNRQGAYSSRPWREAWVSIPPGPALLAAQSLLRSKSGPAILG